MNKEHLSEIMRLRNEHDEQMAALKQEHESVRKDLEERLIEKNVEIKQMKDNHFQMNSIVLEQKQMIRVNEDIKS